MISDILNFLAASFGPVLTVIGIAAGLIGSILILNRDKALRIQSEVILRSTEIIQKYNETIAEIQSNYVTLMNAKEELENKMNIVEADLRSKLQKKEELIAELQDKINHLNDQNEGNKVSISSLEIKIDEYTKQIAEYEKTIAELRVQIKDLECQLQAERNSRAIDAASFSEEKKNLQTQVDVLRGILESTNPPQDKSTP